MAVSSTVGTKIEIRVACKHLKDQDTTSNSDPFVVLFISQNKKGPWRALDRTEVVMDEHDPQFAKPFILDYIFEKKMFLKWEVFDQDNQVVNISSDLKNHDFLGWATTDIAELVHSQGQTQTKALTTRNNKKQKNDSGRLSMITFHIEEVSANNDIVHFKFAAKGLPRMDWLGGGDPFYEISKLRENGEWVKVFRGEHINNTTSPKWKDQSLSLVNLSNGDIDRPLKITLFDWEKNSNPEYIGELETSVRQMAETTTSLQIKKKGKKKGNLLILKCNLEKRHGFMDYLSGGIDVSFLVAIDFTGSNGHPDDLISLHHRQGPHRSSPYLDAINQVGRILDPYDSDHNYPVWGFGAAINGCVDHCFPLNFNTHNPEVRGVDGIVQAYHNALDRQMLQFSGPTLFSQILRNAHAIASQPAPHGRQQYYVLLILTDGIVNDMDSTKDILCQMAGLPISVLIVGIGTEDFTKMNELDGDGVPLTNSRGQRIERDIVQFVAMNQFIGSPPGSLAEATLAEIPSQLVNFYQSRGIEPLPRTMAPDIANVEQQLLSQPTEFGPPREEPLPEGWVEIVDPSSGKPYYVHHSSQTTQWERPAN